MASLSTVIQGLLVDQLPEYEISNDAIGYLCDFSEKLLAHIVNRHNTEVSTVEVRGAILSTFPSDWAEQILRAATAQLGAPHAEEKDALLKQEISDFELIDAEQVVPEVERKASGNLFLSPEFIKSFLSSRLESEACIYVSVCVESVLSKMIHQGLHSLRQHIGEDQMTITRVALVEAIERDDQLGQLAKSLNIYEVTSDDIGADFEPILHDSLEVEEEKGEETTESSDTTSKVWSEIKESTELKASDVHHDNEAKESTDTTEANELKIEEEEKDELKEETPVQVPDVVEPEVVELNVVDEKEGEPVFEPSVVDADEKEDEKEDRKEDVKKDEIELSLENSTPQSDFEKIEEVSPQNAQKEEKVVEEKITSPIEQMAPAELFANPSDLALARKPIVNLHARCCPYFDASTFAIHMLSSIVELFIRHVIRETGRIARPHSRVAREHAREAVRRLTTFQSQMLDEMNCSDDNIFKECVSHQVKIVPRPPEWNTDTESYIAEVVLYVCSRIMLVAAAQARLAGLWVIQSHHIATASLQLLPSPSPISQLVQKLVDQNVPEGPLAAIPSAPRIKAAEMLYLNSIIKETPLQLDNQLLVIFVFLVTLSIHTLCCVR